MWNHLHSIKTKVSGITSRFFQTKRSGALIFVIVFAALGTTLLLLNRAAPDNGSGQYTIMVNNQRPDMESSYQNLVNSQTNLAFRSTNPDPTTPETNNWE